jgi:hypothetical protein
MRCPAGLRVKLSQAVSLLYFLTPHALIFSQIENKPLYDYFDRSSYDRARLLYFGGSSPGLDLKNCLRSIDHLRYPGSFRR